MEWIKLAKSWYSKHKEHVDEIVMNETKNLAPSEEDLNHSELWKPQNWKWFLEERVE